MSTVDLYNLKNEKVGKVELPAALFEVAVKKEVLQQVVRWQLASRRQGTHMTKTRAFVSGGGKKPFKQKGTGNARQGTSRSPLMPGGAKLFGPMPRDYSYALPKKVRRLGIRMALSHLLAEGKLKVVDSLESSTGKTKDLAATLAKFGAPKALLLSATKNEKFDRASKNLPAYRYLQIEGVNVFDLLKYNNLILTKDSVKSLESKLAE